MTEIISAVKKDFGPLQKIIWPIHNYELKKFIPLSFIMFCILFNYTVLRDIKDALVTDATGSANVISFLKVYCVTPAAILFVILYAKLTTFLKNEYVFYVIMLFFLIFFGLFAFFIGPNAQALHPSEAFIHKLQHDFPHWIGFIDILAYWSYSLFYVLTELWGSAMLGLMFWQFANQVVRMNEAKRFYGLFVVIGNLALISSGQVVKFCFKPEFVRKFFPYADWDFSMQLMISAVVIIGVITMMLYRWMHLVVLTDPLYYDETTHSSDHKKNKPGLWQSAKIIFTSPELGLIAILIMASGVTINLIEIQWKHQVLLHFTGDKSAYTAFMGDYSSATGLATILFSLLIGSSILRKCSWLTAAIITPLVTLVGGIILFVLIICVQVDSLHGFMVKILLKISTDPITLAVFVGAAIVVATKSIKYCLFDPTQEMAYIPLGEELKTKGKAAIDVIGGRVGKAGGSLVLIILSMVFLTKDVIILAPYALIVFIVACLAWIIAARVLSRKFLSAVSANGKIF